MGDSGATCGVCDGGPITWVAVERDGRVARVARCAEHRPKDGPSRYIADVRP
ncbi:MAG: hypothetical protein LC754_10430 [Acidobacteria bacterium]|nr:hypothetical protein [Acidobacteriota bacterium]